MAPEISVRPIENGWIAHLDSEALDHVKTFWATTAHDAFSLAYSELEKAARKSRGLSLATAREVYNG
jgi:hypothetical protein